MRMLRPPAYNVRDAESIQHAAALTGQRRGAVVLPPPSKRTKLPSFSSGEAMTTAIAATIAVTTEPPSPAAPAVAAVTTVQAPAAAVVTASTALTALRQSRENSQRRVRRGAAPRSKQMHWSAEGSETPEEVRRRV